MLNQSQVWRAQAFPADVLSHYTWTSERSLHPRSAAACHSANAAGSPELCKSLHLPPLSLVESAPPCVATVANCTSERGAHPRPAVLVSKRSICA